MKPAPRTILHPDLYPGTTRKDAKAEALRKRANEAYANGDFEAALTHYSASALHDPTEATTWSNRSATLLQLDRAEDAFDDAERCLWLDPAFGKGYLRRGAAEWRLGRRADARASYEAGLKQDPGNVRLMEELARCEARADTEPAQAARAAVFRTMLVSPSLDVEGLFELLQAPERLTAAAVSERAQSLDALLEYLCRTLECDLVVLRDCAPLREAYDRATFACGLCAVCEPWSLQNVAWSRRWRQRRRSTQASSSARSRAPRRDSIARRAWWTRCATRCAAAGAWSKDVGATASPSSPRTRWPCSPRRRTRLTA